MPPAVNSNQALYIWSRDFLQNIYADKNIDPLYIRTLAMLITGMLLGPHIQLFAIAMCVPLMIKLPSLVRRFERFVADEQVEVEKYFEPFVRAMLISLGNETAYLLIDCTQAGPQCRTLFIGLAYHHTVLPVVWKTLKGKKGHVKGQFQKELLDQVYPRLRYCRRVIVLGDAEFSNEPVIRWLRSVGWDFVLRFQHSYLLQTQPGVAWQAAADLAQRAGLQAGQVRHWEDLVYTQEHHIPNLTVTVNWGEQEAEPWYLVSSLAASEAPHLIYPMRFWIETLFGHHKSRGFQLARTHLTEPEQIDRLVLALAIATYITLGLGTELIVTGLTKLVDRTDRRDLSLFQLGWRYLYRLLALDRLVEFKIRFRWDIKLPPAGFQAAQ